MKRSWFAQGACAVFVLAMAGCQDSPDDLSPADDVTQGDAGSSVDPATNPEDASVTVPKDKPPTKRDASAPSEDAGSVEQPDAASDEHDAATPDAEVEHDAGHDAGPAAPRFDEVYEVIAAKCVGCHGAGKPLDMSTAELAQSALVGVAAQYPACAGTGSDVPVRVVAGDVEASLLIAKLEGKQSCGKQMPPAALLEAEQIDVFRAWIAGGAQ